MVGGRKTKKMYFHRTVIIYEDEEQKKSFVFLFLSLLRYCGVWGSYGLGFIYSFTHSLIYIQRWTLTLPQQHSQQLVEQRRLHRMLQLSYQPQPYTLLQLLNKLAVLETMAFLIMVLSPEKCTHHKIVNKKAKIAQHLNK